MNTQLIYPLQVGEQYIGYLRFESYESLTDTQKSEAIRALAQASKVFEAVMSSGELRPGKDAIDGD